MNEKPKASVNKAKDVETKKVNKKKRETLAVEFYELSIHRAKLIEQLNRTNARCNQIATQMEALK